METGIDLMKLRGMDITKKQWNDNDFHRAQLPPNVICFCCHESISLPKVKIDEEEKFICEECY